MQVNNIPLFKMFCNIIEIPMVIKSLDFTNKNRGKI